RGSGLVLATQKGGGSTGRGTGRRRRRVQPAPSGLLEREHRAKPRGAEEERDEIGPGAAVRVVPLPDQLDLVELPCLAKPEGVADAGSGRIPDADLHAAGEAERGDPEVADALQPRDRRAEVA